MKCEPAKRFLQMMSVSLENTTAFGFSIHRLKSVLGKQNAEKLQEGVLNIIFEPIKLFSPLIRFLHENESNVAAKILRNTKLLNFV